MKVLLRPVVANLNNIQPNAQISPYFYTLPNDDAVARRPQMERRSGVVCADLIDYREGGSRAIYNICVYSLKRLVCVTDAPSIPSSISSGARYASVPRPNRDRTIL